MAIKGQSLFPMFTMAQVFKRIEAFKADANDRMVASLAYVGETVVNAARENEAVSYKNQTGNLRSSIGYTITYDGAILFDNIKPARSDDGGKGTSTAHDWVQENAKIIHEPNKFVLTVFAGMEYAAAVEFHKYDVISGSTLQAPQLIKEFKDKLGIQ